ncbi:hypothetical protein ASC61_06260 [Aeromicrobium sp. Root344]|uniref:CbrC family protein n=1 Tax=Aeromicrobium sp. Root344 TaxID=1736521 RepID=UPI0006F35567|nr:CbrC family protein [Aeromicrobium sp. Root344]KQV74638.1 hypothetical protein ASC61_06260 [Aeromicrobium sp. Root344]
MSQELPHFRYHPDPLGTGSVVTSDEECERCGEAPGYVYRGPSYAVDEVESLCPWCIAAGSAAEEFDAEFATADEAPDNVPARVVEEIVRRTPGFAGWQQERWLFHCGDGAEFLGRAGWDTVASHPELVPTLVAEGWREDALPRLSVDGDLVAYLFRCRHCGAHLAYADAS